MPQLPHYEVFFEEVRGLTKDTSVQTGFGDARHCAGDEQ